MTITEKEVLKVDERIVSFLRAQTVLTIATSDANIPYCATCFYAYSTEYNVLVFKSSPDTTHISQGLANCHVAGSVLPDKLITGKVKGIQYSGVFEKPGGELQAEVQKEYYKKYPFALAMGGDLWIIKLSWIKFTDNTLGFGKKLTWGELSQEGISL